MGNIGTLTSERIMVLRSQELVNIDVPVQYLIEELQQYQSQYTKVSTSHRFVRREDKMYLSVTYFEEETDEEFSKRISRNAAYKVAKQAEADAKDKEDRDNYELLKLKFDKVPDDSSNEIQQMQVAPTTIQTVYSFIKYKIGRGS